MSIVRLEGEITCTNVSGKVTKLTIRTVEDLETAVSVLLGAQRRHVKYSTLDGFFKDCVLVTGKPVDRVYRLDVGHAFDAWKVANGIAGKFGRNVMYERFENLEGIYKLRPNNRALFVGVVLLKPSISKVNSADDCDLI